MRFLVPLLALMLWAGAAHAQSVCSSTGEVCGVTVPPITPITVVPAATGGKGRIYYRLSNPDNVGGAIAWCSRGLTPAPHAAGSFAIAPLGNPSGMASTEEFPVTPYGYVPQSAVTCVSDGGLSGSASAVLTVEAH